MSLFVTTHVDLSRALPWTGRVVRVREIRNSFRIQKEKLIGRLRRRWEYSKRLLRVGDGYGRISPLMADFGVIDVKRFRFCCHIVNQLV